jgi:hypothetical protein
MTWRRASRQPWIGKRRSCGNWKRKSPPLSIQSPIAGKVTRIFMHPGNFVNPGEPILEIRSEKAEFVIAYLKPPWHSIPNPAPRWKSFRDAESGRSQEERKSLTSGLNSHFYPPFSNVRCH